MLYNYCPNCFSLNIIYKPENRLHKCNACGFIGNCKQDSIDKINDLRKGTTKNTYQEKTETIVKETFTLDDDFGIESIDEDQSFKDSNDNKIEEKNLNNAMQFSNKERPSQRSSNADISPDERVKKRFGDKIKNNDWELV